ncbi:SMP-30/gluconolactonase/LRE family protein [Parafrankia elaeagni]|uniref:SMP-30/gluconolactonase/LRE family protein n=1 Tax=Parafrankia elaeagni TaxID=222534 RepID=UPI000381092E|nr:SMP-30/gluconolactonase/LRE family protein [Parafrankia elaeagni]
MSLQGARYVSATSISVADGWSLERLTPPSRLFGANGLRTGPDGRVYVAQVTGSQISALDVETGALETISAKGGDIIGPDDVAFDPAGNLYATEVMDGRVSVLGADGRTRVLRDDLPSANGITVHQGRLFVGECRIGGRLMELDLDGGEPRILAENVAMPNAMEVGPDGLLYYPVMGTNDIWRIHPDGGEPERVAGDLGVPDSVKFDAEGFIVSTQVHSGQVLRINPRNGDRTVLAQLGPGLDNCTFVGDRLFVSSFTGAITEILGDGRTQETLPGGLTWPLGLTVDAEGTLFIADGTFFYALTPGGTPQTLGMLFSPNYPGFVRSVQAIGPGEFLVGTASGTVVRYRPAAQESEILAEGLDQVYGVAAAPTGAVAVADFGTGQVLLVRSGGQPEVVASGLAKPLGVAFAPDGTLLVSESGAGRVVGITGPKVDTVVDNLSDPQGILVHGGRIHIVDSGSKELVSVDLAGGDRQVIARNLPLGAPPGVVPKPLRGMAPFSGPQGPFAGIAVGPDGTLYVSADAEGSVLALTQAG